MKVGDKVRVKSLEEVLKIEGVEDYDDVGDPCITSYMVEHFGKEGLITACDEYEDCMVLFDEDEWEFKKEWLDPLYTIKIDGIDYGRLASFDDNSIKVDEIVASLEKDSELYYKIKNKEEAYFFSSTLNSSGFFNFVQEFVGLFENGKDCLSLYKGYDYKDYALVDENEALEIIKVKYEPTKTIVNPTYDDLKHLFIDVKDLAGGSISFNVSADYEPEYLYDTVEKPKHYNVFEKEVIYTIKDLLDNNSNYKEFDSYCIGNALKYIFRAGLKGDYYEDLEKARYYINKILEGEES